MDLSRLLPDLPPVVVLCAYGASLVVNGLSSTGTLGGKSIGQLSDENPTYVTPDGLTFAVWSVIYLLEGVLVCAQMRPTPHAEELLSQKCPLTGLPVRWRILLFIVANTAWLPIYLQEQWTLSFLVILVYLAGLISVYTALNTKSTESVAEWVTYGAGVSANASWLLVASAANAFTVGKHSGWEDSYGIGGTAKAAACVVMVVAAIGIAMAVVRRDFVWSAVAAWAAAGIYRMQTVPDQESFPVVSHSPYLANVAWWGSLLVTLASVVGLLLMLKEGLPGKPRYEDESLMSVVE